MLDLSFSYGLREAVAAHGLAATDFAVTDLVFELLYLAEANAAVIAEARKAAERLRRARAQALEQALTDPLTGVLNRRGLDRALAQLAERGRPFGLVHIDLDRFKQINDLFGHATGDQVLIEVAGRLRKTVRAQDLVARIGGDEFVVVLVDLSENARLQTLAERILSALSEPIHKGPLAGQPISASLGVVGWAGGVADAERLLKAADRALYASKEAGRGRVTFSSETNTP